MATLPCEMVLLKNHNDPELNEATCRARFSHSKQLLKNIHPVTLAAFPFTDEKVVTVATLKIHRMTDSTQLQQPRRKTSRENDCTQD